MSFTSVLKTIGKDIKGVFTWLGSAQGQATVTGAEGIASTVGTLFGVGPVVNGAISLFNTFATEAIKVETLAAAAGAQDGTGAQKAAAVVASVTPEVVAFAQANGLSTPTSSEILTMNNAVVAFLNALGTGATATNPANGVQVTNETPVAAGVPVS